MIGTASSSHVGGITQNKVNVMVTLVLDDYAEGAR